MILRNYDNPSVPQPMFTAGIILLCVSVFIWQTSLAPERAVYASGMIPAVLFGKASLPHGIVTVSPEVSIVTSMFLHGDVMHLLGNILYLWIFGRYVERSMGHARFIAFYLLCGAAGALAHASYHPHSMAALIGASGAISGVLGGYFMLFPRAYVTVCTKRIPAFILLGLWIALPALYSLAASGQSGRLAFWAHFGGFVAGALLIVPFRSKEYRLFGGP